MRREAFSIPVQGQDLFGSVYSPDQPPQPQARFVIFLHGWAGYRTGPHGMFVEYSKKLCLQGFHCLLFDFRGRGFSQGEAEGTTLNTMMNDLEGVMQFVQSDFKPAKVILVGICSGAKLALYYAKSGKLPIHHIVELSSPTLWAGNESEIERKRTQNLISTYTGKALQAATWKKLIQGRVNYRKISQMILHSARIGLTFGKGKTPKKRDAQKSVHQFEKFEGHVLMIHGEKDPETDVATRQITDYLKKQEVSHELRIIKGANHSFYSIAWKNEIYEAIAEDLNRYRLAPDTDFTNQIHQIETL